MSAAMKVAPKDAGLKKEFPTVRVVGGGLSVCECRRLEFKLQLVLVGNNLKVELQCVELSEQKPRW
jgi:hypothetical protein